MRFLTLGRDSFLAIIRRTDVIQVTEGKPWPLSPWKPPADQVVTKPRLATETKVSCYG